MAHREPVIRDLFESFVPEEDRVQRLGTKIDPLALLAMPGNADRGRELFAKPKKSLQCASCHRIGTQGKAVGPDLTDVGKGCDLSEATTRGSCELEFFGFCRELKWSWRKRRPLRS